MCPSWVPHVDKRWRSTPIILKTLGVEGSITVLVGPKKFETCPPAGRGGTPSAQVPASMLGWKRRGGSSHGYETRVEVLFRNWQVVGFEGGFRHGTRSRANWGTRRPEFEATVGERNFPRRPNEVTQRSICP